MTIAAGFLHKDGVLLCADTQHETWTMKSHATKLHQFAYWDGQIAFAYAGNSAFALATLGKYKKQLQAAPPGRDPVEIFEETLDREYKRVVYPHPDRLSDPSVGYGFLLGVHRKSVGRAELYSTLETTVTAVGSYESIGMGKGLTDYLVLPTFTNGQPEHDVLCLAALVVSIVKDHVPSCGGMSLLLSLHNDGTVRTFYGDHMVEHMERETRAYFMKAQRLLFQHADAQMSDDDFHRNLEHFSSHVLGMRKRWMETWNKYQPRPVQ